ncbi:hypothetical protein G0S15_001367 [Salmonella enterica]|nr:hypothetical protein [Salmonella enterica]
MKAYFDENANLLIEPKNNIESAALMMWREIKESDNRSIYEFLSGEKLSLKAIDGNANCNARSVTK